MAQAFLVGFPENSLTKKNFLSCFKKVYRFIKAARNGPGAETIPNGNQEKCTPKCRMGVHAVK